MDVPTVLALIGSIALLTGLVGGGIEAKEIKIPLMPRWSRILSSIVGALFIGIAIWLSVYPPHPASTQDPTSTPTVLSGFNPTSTYTPMAQSSTTPTSTLEVINPRLDLYVETIDGCTVKINGFVKDKPGPMVWDWGDENFTKGWFSQEHIYAQSGTYVLTVTTSSGMSRSITYYVNCNETPTVETISGTPVPDSPPGAYVWLDWPDDSNFNYDIDLTVTSGWTDTNILFWAHQFGFVNGPGGYIGLQVVEGEPKAIFSIWDALRGSEGCVTFTGEGSGWKCLREYQWQIGHKYRLRIWVGDEDVQGNMSWIGAVYDYATGTEVQLGSILVPSGRDMLSASSVTWVEYAGFTSCNVPYTHAVWSNPIVRNAAGTSQPLQAKVAYGISPCALSNVEYLGDLNYSLEAGIGATRVTPEEETLWP